MGTSSYLIRRLRLERKPQASDSYAIDIVPGPRQENVMLAETYLSWQSIRNCYHFVAQRHGR